MGQRSHLDLYGKDQSHQDHYHSPCHVPVSAISSLVCDEDLIAFLLLEDSKYDK